MPLPFDFQEGKGVVLLDNNNNNNNNTQQQELVVPYANPLVHFQDFVNNNNKRNNFINEPTSVLDNITTSPSPPASTSTLSFSHGGADNAAVAPLSSKWPENQETTTTTSNAGVLDLHHFPPPPVTITTGNEKCDWENGDSDQDQAMLRWIMGDVGDPSLGLNKLLSTAAAGGGACGGGGGGGVPPDIEFNGGFGVVDQGFNFVSLDSGNLSSNPHISPAPEMFNHQTLHQNQIFSPLNDTQMLPLDIKPNLFNTHLPFEQQFLMPRNNNNNNPVSIEYNSPMHKNPVFDSASTQLQLLQKSPSMKQYQQQQQGIIDQLFKVADLIQTANNPILAQGILARLNHQLSPVGKPFERAAFYFKEALQLLIHSVQNNMNPQVPTTTGGCTPFSLIFKIGAYKSFSEVSPFIQFANFTCNQALLESLNGFDQIHIIDFDIGYGGQWASLMQELALRNNGVSYIKITAFVSPSTHDQLELGLTRENLIHFASEINVGFDLEIVNIDVLASASWSLPFHLSDNEAIAVNLPIHVFSNHQTQIPSVLRFVKSLSPKIVVSVDRGCDRTDLSFPSHLIHALQSYSNLLESLDAVNMNLDSLQKIERFLVQPAVEKIVLGRFPYPDKTQHWRNLFVSAGFSPLLFSNFTESQAECLVKRTPVLEFHVEKRNSSLVLCWQRRELVSVSAWKC